MGKTRKRRTAPRAAFPKGFDPFAPEAMQRRDRLMNALKAGYSERSERALGALAEMFPKG